MAEPFKLEVVPETDAPETVKPANDAATTMFMMALGALSKRALVALASLFTLITVGSCFWLYMSRSTLDPQELILCGMYAVFVLAANVIVRRA
jgi:hypothetical protein